MRRLVLLCMALAASAATARAQVAPPTPATGSFPAPQKVEAQVPQKAPIVSFKAGTELVALNVTVTDNDNRYLRGLTKDDFAVYEDGVQQALSFFATNDVPFDLTIMLDTSASMSDKLPLAQKAAIGFARTLRPGDRGEVMAFNDQVQLLEPFTPDVSRLEAAIDKTTARGGTALYNALYIALQQFQKLNRANTEVRRQAIVVLTDGEDTASLLSFDDVLDRVKRAGIAVYPISLVSEFEVSKLAASGGPRYFSQSDYGLRTFARESGGRVFFPLAASELNGIYQAIAEELSVQYSLGYAPKNTRPDGAFRRVVVRVDQPGAQPRTRSGYYAARPVQASLLPPK